ncbi:MAG: hypothetical protein ACR2ID_03405 [Chthoniobacterales bacterium]
MRAPDLERLWRAAGVLPEVDPEMPYGFDTRVLALARGTRREASQLRRLLQRIAVAAAVVAACASAAAYWQMSENDELGEPLTNAYAFADNAIDLEVFP